VTAVNRALQDLCKRKKDSRFVYPARLAATQVEKDCPHASDVPLEEHQPMSQEAVVARSAKLVDINRRGV